MTVASAENRRFVDAAVLQAFENEIGDPVIAREFVRDFVGVWADRYEKLATAVARRDRAAALDAVLSIKITSLMLGAALLAELASDLEDLIRQSDMDGAIAGMPHLLLCGNQTVEVLRNEQL
ncbi:Hpt domain-containing protein [Arthrobacter sp. H14]|uniref:Hpt domain-containing protein n=1 Tax=Arthrobacter sp. H14 TaxID=1312959 RepID=UPI0004B8A6C5|nr:Hpt domain-containing protein [Arthrobacter sp. H14]